jgi:hypothetical protein
MPLPAPDANAYATLTAMLAPALFMTATGSLLLSANNRLSRVVDRLRGQVDLVDKLGQGTLTVDYPEERIEKSLEDISRLKQRGGRLLRAIGRLYLAFAAFVGTSLTLALDSWTSYSISILPTGLAVVGVFMLLLGCFNLFREAYGGVANLHAEVTFLEKLRRKRREAKDPVPPQPKVS